MSSRSSNPLDFYIPLSRNSFFLGVFPHTATFVESSGVLDTALILLGKTVSTSGGHMLDTVDTLWTPTRLYLCSGPGNGIIVELPNSGIARTCCTYFTHVSAISPDNSS